MTQFKFIDSAHVTYCLIQITEYIDGKTINSEQFLGKFNVEKVINSFGLD